MLRTQPFGRSSSSVLKRTLIAALALVLAVDSFGLRSFGIRQAEACPFCGAPQTTLSEDIKSNDVAVICKLVNRPPKQEADAPPEASKCTFEVVQVIKGAEVLAKQPDPKKFKILYYGEQPLETKFLAFGLDPMNLEWGTPTLVTDRSTAYLLALPTLPNSGAKRLDFFQDYFEDQDSLLAADAYDEFAKSPYSDLKALKPDMQRDRLLAWIQDKNVTTTRRRLYLCMLSVCGTKDDLPLLETLINDQERWIRQSLDALIGSYLAIKGEEGLPLVEDLFLKNQKAEYTDAYATIMALRFMGQESDVISRARLTQSMRYLLDNPKLADLIVPDLARWQDWSAMDKLVQLFINADAETAWVRLPVVNYLRACPLPEAKARLAELTKIDPEVVKRAMTYYPSPGATASDIGSPKETPAAAAPTSPVPPSNPPGATGS